jgi:hypothetical protein
MIVSDAEADRKIKVDLDSSRRPKAHTQYRRDEAARTSNKPHRSCSGPFRFNLAIIERFERSIHNMSLSASENETRSCVCDTDPRESGYNLQVRPRSNETHDQANR